MGAQKSLERHDVEAQVRFDRQVICPILSGPESLLFWTTKEEWNGEETQAGRDHRQAA